MKHFFLLLICILLQLGIPIEAMHRPYTSYTTEETFVDDFYECFAPPVEVQELFEREKTCILEPYFLGSGLLKTLPLWHVRGQRSLQHFILQKRAAAVIQQRKLTRLKVAQTYIYCLERKPYMFTQCTKSQSLGCFDVEEVQQLITFVLVTGYKDNVMQHLIRDENGMLVIVDICPENFCSSSSPRCSFFSSWYPLLSTLSNEGKKNVEAWLHNSFSCLNVTGLWYTTAFDQEYNFGAVIKVFRLKVLL